MKKLQDMFLPSGSRQRKILQPVLDLIHLIILEPLRQIYRLLIRSLDTIRRDGWRVFWQKTRRKIGIVLNKIFIWKKVRELENQLRQLQDNIYIKNYQNALSSASGEKTPAYIPFTQNDFVSAPALVRLIAFYLPQFHPIAENDLWWGRGFTEWSNVSKAVPQFMGHYQPHLPGELGFYDLRLPEVQERQVEMARNYGLQGFAFHYYWFNGKRLLERPLDNYINNPKIDFPFCICWANENWTRRWDGLENDILIAQKHSPESDIAFIQDIAPLLRDPRYIRIGSRPLIIVYRAHLLPKPANTVQSWREYCQQEGLGNPYLVSVQAFGFNNPESVGFDAAVEFPPLSKHGFFEINSFQDILNPQYSGKIYDYHDVIRTFGYRTLPNFKLFRGVFPGWDNEARKPGRGFTFAFSTPHAYQHWLHRVSQETILTEPDPEKRLVFVNAWNEWAEGAHLEPDRKYGYAYLQATATALNALTTEDPRIEKEKQLFGKPIQKSHNTAVFLHLFYPALWDELSSYLNNLKGDFDLFISIPNTVEMDMNVLSAYHPNTYIYRCPNHGRDVAPFLQMYRVVAHYQYNQALKLHTKKSQHRQDGDKWRTDLYEKLIGSPELIQTIIQTLNQDESQRPGIIAPDDHVVSSQFYLASNKEKIEKLANLANLNYFGEEFQFAAGSMFWFKMESLFPISLLPIQTADFDPEQGQVDGTLAHAMERMFGMFTYKMGYQMYLSNGETVFLYGTKPLPKHYKFARAHHNR